MQPVVTSPPSKKKGKYDITFKLKVIQWAEKHSNRAAGSKFGLNESTIRGWRKSAIANNLDSFGEIPRGVLSLHQSTTGHQASKQSLMVHHDDDDQIHLNHLHNHSEDLQSSISIKVNRMRSAAAGCESPPQTLALDERDLARLSCSPSDDGYYDDVCYQEEVVESPSQSPVPAAVLQPSFRSTATNFSQTPVPQAPSIHTALKTISHQITSKPFPEISLPFTVIVCRSVRDHWFQRLESERAMSMTTPAAATATNQVVDPELDVFARTLGLERRS